MPTIKANNSTRVYFAVPTHYTTGVEFETWDAAVAVAKASMKPFDFGGHSRAFVDVRHTVTSQFGSTDEAIQRYEITNEEEDQS